MHKGASDRAAGPRLWTAVAAAALLAGLAGSASAARAGMDGWSVQLPPGCTAQWQRVPSNPLYNAQERADVAADPSQVLKPNYYNMPEHLLLDLAGCFPGDGKRETSLRVIPLATYLTIYDRHEGEHSSWPLKSLQKLRTWLGGELRGDMPFLPFIDASLYYTGWHKALRFQRGHGARVLTQIAVERDFALRSRFEYIFQGLSDDGEHFVLLTLPVQLDGLAGDDDRTHLGFERDRVFHDEKSYQGYAAAVAAWLRSGAAKPQPAPERLDELLTSLRHTQKTAKR